MFPRHLLCFIILYNTSTSRLVFLLKKKKKERTNPNKNQNQPQTNTLPCLAFSNLVKGMCLLKLTTVSWSLLRWILPFSGAISTDSWFFCIRWICILRQISAVLILLQSHTLKQHFWIRQIDTCSVFWGHLPCRSRYWYPLVSLLAQMLLMEWSYNTVFSNHWKVLVQFIMWFQVEFPLFLDGSFLQNMS